MAVRQEIDAATLCRMLRGWAQDDDASLPQLLADAVGTLVDSNTLADGTRLPSQRALATALGVARGTVTEAYQILEARGQLRSRTGSGSRVRRRGRTPRPSTATEGRLASFAGHETPALDLSSGALPGLPMVHEAVAGLDRDELADEVAHDGYHPAGLPRLRAAIADRYTRDGLPTAPEQILVTSGSQQAVWLLAHVFLGPGDEVLVEDPSYRGALEAFRAVGAQLCAVPLRDDGMDVAHVDRILHRRGPRMVYCQPTAHNPTGRSVSARARRELGHTMTRHGVFVVEDGSSAEVMLDGARRESLATVVPAEQVVSIGTASKLFWGGLRVGWVRGSQPTIARLTEAKKAVDLATAVVDQLLVADLLGQADTARGLRATALRDGLRAAEKLLVERRPHWRWLRPTGGTGLWVDTGQDAVALAEHGKRHGVRVAAGPAFSAVNGFRQHLRIPLWHSHSELAEGLDRLLG